ncbi:hypothetical protein IV203_038585 [Nitzschia inconspicua]|uniref:Uncharacterized protein n=1 Tax=Nitzschia inconspicua TaxID=303405 RepID=A0A9K3PZ45_9STRA|nr:hypothetical protein IV203_038585 [Nitzschia inconspicua]
MSSSGASMASTSSAHDGMVVVQPWQSSSNARRIQTIPELLRMRQTFGVASPRHDPLVRWVGSSFSPQVTTPYLASRVAWNPRRLQNTILVVGPGTPASVVTASSKKLRGSAARSRRSGAGSSESSASVENESVAPDGEEVQQEEDAPMNDREEEDEEEGSSRDGSRRRRRLFVRRTESSDSDDMSMDAEEEYEFLARSVNDDEGEDDSDDSSEGQDDEEDDDVYLDEERLTRASLLRRAFGRVPPMNLKTRQPHYCPSMRHGGCINTAAWLDAGWRLSTVNTNDPMSSSVAVHGIATDECPTQLVTSGDDQLVKFWDVRDAMGMSSPLPGGRATICPFSASQSRNPHDLREEWEEFQNSRTHSRHLKSSQKSSNENSNDFHLPGSVRLLSTLHTGHQGNVFHVTPLVGKPGVVATCGADGFLRLTNVETGDSTVVVSPEFEEEMLPIGIFRLRSSSMCYSHHFINQNVGLLCSETGLKRFDLRLSPREQATQRLIGGTMFRTCKACAILATPSTSSTAQVEDSDATYVFVGGSSRLVALCDLRITDGSQNHLVQIYAPSGLTPNSHVSVSGLDLSRDRQELLVSYESDQIYTFPVFPESKLRGCSVVSQVEEVQDSSAPSDGAREDKKTVKPLHELATYGAHLNRFTFLKNARYAGPRDEYICTGSDSGHAWVYEKATGAVASFWMADHSTCNGVIPHPSLPVFVTYGIDSTAKLWRSTIPVDKDLDDSAVGRRRHFRESSYVMSPTTRDWDVVQSALRNLDLREGFLEETDIYPDDIPNTRALQGRISRSWGREPSSNIPGIPKIGNDLHNIERTLQENLYTCLRSVYDEEDVPVESGNEELKHRISVIRLRYQADRLGLSWNLSVPWAMERQQTVATKEDKLRDNSEDHEVDPADLVPDFPSDWMPYDPEMSFKPFNFCKYFKLDEYLPFYLNRYSFLSEANGIAPELLREVVRDDATFPSDEIDGGREFNRRKSEAILLETMKTLKDGGNRALKNGSYNIAAMRYDKAIQYGSMIYLKSFSSTVEGRISLLKTLVISRLNMSLLLLKPLFSELQVAERQAKLALKDLDQISDLYQDDKRMGAGSTDEILSLRAKAFFRRGSAQFEMGDYENAIESFEESIGCTKRQSEGNSKPDQLVVRRLAEAKREHVKRKKRQRKKFKIAFASTSSPLAASPHSPTSSSGSMNASETPSASSPTRKPGVVTDPKPHATARTTDNVEAQSNERT